MNRPAWFLVVVACGPAAGSAQEPTARFGTTVAINSGLRGEIYHLHRDTEWLPVFRKMKPVGTIYTSPPANAEDWKLPDAAKQQDR